MSGARLSTARAAAVTGGTLRRDGTGAINGVDIDSRRVSPGQAFVAIEGERFDGHCFCGAAARAGAALLVVEHEPEEALPEGVELLVVADTRRALADLARAWLADVQPAVIGITGSVGKTTAKELTRAVLARRGSTHSNPGNFNNDLGLPLTVLSMPAGTAYLVLEMGMNAPGEIAYLTSITPPDVGVITCIAPVHLEGLGTLEAVAAAKAELLHGLRAGGWAVLPGQEPLLAPHIGAIPLDRRLHFGVSEEDDVRLARVDAQGTAGSRVVLALRDRELAFHLPVVGAHHAANAAAAVAVGLVLGVDDAQIIEALEDPPAGLGHRSTLRALGSWHLLDDCYNASPLSMRAALDTLGQLAGSDHRAAVLGMMAELGDETEAYHLEIGAHAAASGLDLLVVVDSPAIARGAREGGMPGARLIEVADAAAAADELVRRAGPGAWVLVKGSRRVQLERTIERLETLVGGEGDPEAGSATQRHSPASSGAGS